MEKVLTQILDELKSLRDGQDELKIDMKEVKRLASAVFDQTADLSEFKTSTTGSLLRIETEINTIEKVTAKNCFDITHLKAIK